MCIVRERFPAVFFNHEMSVSSICIFYRLALQFETSAYTPSSECSTMLSKGEPLSFKLLFSTLEFLCPEDDGVVCTQSSGPD